MGKPLESLVGTMTVAQLARVAGLSVDEVVAVTLGRDGGAVARQGRGVRPARRPAAEAVRPNARGNKYERAAAYTQKVGDAVRAAKAPISAADVRRKVGGNATRCRLALDRLIAAGEIGHNGGKTAARRYHAR